jgi:hypothetical protein
MKFKFVKKVEGAVKAYTGALIVTGEIIELTGWLAEKALNNPDYLKVEDQVIAESEIQEEPAEIRAETAEPVVQIKQRKKAGK